MGKAWPALGIHVPGCDPQLQELVLAELDDYQPSAIQDADDTSPLRAFFATTEARDAAAHALATAFGSHLFVEAIDVEDEDWAARSQAELRAITIGRIVVAPPWDAVLGSDPRTVRGPDVGSARKGYSGPVRGSDPIVVIQPSMGFGTGHHATTRLMLKALQELPLEGRTVFDIGCGSGVLTIAAAKLGAQSALGIDIDPDALDNARENSVLNDTGARVRFTEGDFREMSLQADVVMANLTGALLQHSAAKLVECVARGGQLIVSGFMDVERAQVVSALENWLTLDGEAQEDEWGCAVLTHGPLADSQTSRQT